MNGTTEDSEGDKEDKGKEPERNDRLIAIPLVSHDFETIQTLDDMGQSRLNDITYFFKSYRAMSGSIFTPLGNQSADVAMQLVKQKVC